MLAKGLCRSHYYRARYKAQKAGTLQPRKRGRRAASRKKTGAKKTTAKKTTKRR